MKRRSFLGALAAVAAAPKVLEKVAAQDAVVRTTWPGLPPAAWREAQRGAIITNGTTVNACGVYVAPLQSP